MSRFKTVATWDGPTTFEYLSLLVEHAEKNLVWLPKNPTYVKWIGILQAKCDKVYDVGQLKSKYQQMRVDY